MENNNIGWYAVYTASKAEKKVKERLDKAGVENFLPLQVVARLWNKHEKNIMVPVVPGFIFVRIPAKDVVKVATIQGVTFLLEEEKKYVVIPDVQMDTFQYMLGETSDFIEFAPVTFPTGLESRITCGQLQEITGEVFESQGRNKLIVRMDSLGCALITVPAECMIRK